MAGLVCAEMRERDLDAVLEIERASFHSPWRREHFLFELHENRWARNRVARLGAEILAYACVWELDRELKVNNLAVHPAHRGRGLGQWLLRHVLAAARERGCTLASLEVRPSNHSAVRLYERHGFRAVARRRGYYAAEGEDALVMEAVL